MRKESTIFAVFLLLFAASAARAEIVRILDYHEQPPFNVLQDLPGLPGLTADVTTMLQAAENDGLSYEAVVLSRVRLNRNLESWISGNCPAEGVSCEDGWIVLWATPAWGWGEDADTRFRWVDLYPDANILLAKPGIMVDPSRPSSFTGLTIAATRGHRLPPPLDRMVTEGLVARQDGEGTHALLKRVLSDRAEFTYIMRSTISFARRHRADIATELQYVQEVTTPLSSYMLQAMIPPTRPDLEARLRTLTESPEWSKLLQRYGVDATANHPVSHSPQRAGER
ncbi:hypothetical protein [Gimibacter soli]|uniref:Uncharacterized protein n=1 Tax=Gimibacter soli TaxID=3024400 RepID=A0AAE9XPM3_9PROT|nr:hypothetical protein [Gimibacter soli]WCL54893.1 hypothetical protein PH603_03860 [Gimibacter soli]